MDLYLTGDYRNCSYLNADGQVIYIVETPDSGCFQTVSTVKRHGTGEKDGPAFSNDILTDVGEIAFNASASSSLIQFGGESTYSRSLIRLGGREYETSRFFSKVGRKNDLGFTGLDSMDYKWRFGDNALQLVRRNADKTPIALFLPESLGSSDKPHPATFEIFSGGTHMLDLIIVTFVFARKEYEFRRAKAQNSSMRTRAPGFPNGMAAVALGEALRGR